MRLPAVPITCLVAALASVPSAQDWCFAPSVEQAGNDPVITLLEDLDGDGVLDLVTANAGSGSVSVFLGQGDRSFAPRVDYPTSSAPWDLATGDLDEDGNVDLIVGHDAFNIVSLLMGVGDGTFQPAVNLTAGSRPASVEVGLIDGDSHLDLAVRRSGASTAIFLGAGDGSFTPGTTLSDTGLTGLNLSLVLADLNNDGNLDHASMGAQNTGFFVRLGAGDGTFGPQSAFGVSSIQSVHLTVADLNSNGNLDLISREFTGAIAIGYGLGDGTFVTATVPAVNGALQPEGNLAIADFDLDGDVDIAIGGGAVASNIVVLYPNNGNGTFAAPVTQQLPFALPGSSSTDGTYGATAGDLDGDGRPELVVSSRGTSPPGNNLSVLGNLPLDACTPWTDLGGGVTGGASGTPLLVGVGALTSGSSFALSLLRGEPAATSLFVFGTSAALAPFKGGTLVPNPLLVVPLSVSADGTLVLDGAVPSAGASGLELFVQHWIQDADAPSGFAGSNGLRGTVP